MAQPKPSGRIARKRVIARGALIDAARTIIADKGIEAMTIRDVTDAADMGFGSFYTHFQTKEDLLEAVIEDTLVADADFVDDVIAKIDDAAEAQGKAWLYLLEKAVEDPVWGWFVVRTPMALQRLMQLFRLRMERDLSAGKRRGDFDIPDLAAAEALIGGSLFALVSARLSGDLTKAQSQQGVAMLLRILGMSDAAVSKLMRRLGG